MTFYNTTGETGYKLKKYQRQSIKQEERILNFFHEHPDAEMTRPELHEHVLTEAPVSSITRALSDLRDQGKLVRTTRKRQGTYGRECHCWRLANG